MTRIASRYTRFYKIGAPVLAVLWVVLFILGPMQHDELRGERLIFLLFPLIFFAFIVLMIRKFVWDLVDEVYDCGDSLLVKNRGEEARIQLADVINVSVSTFVNPPRITLRLATESRFGSEITFSPVKKFSFNPFARNHIGEALIIRAHQARVKAGGR